MDLRTWLIILLSVLLLFSLAGTGYLFLLMDEPIPRLIEPETVSPTPSPDLPDDVTMTEIDVYFVTRNYEQLKAERRTIGQPASIEARVRVALEELLKGPRLPELLQTVPVDTEVQSVFWSEADALVVVSLTKDLLQDKPTHALGEWAMIYSIVNTAMAHSTAIKQVQILVDGQEVTAQQSHWDWTHPFQKEETFVHVEIQGG